MGKTAFRRRDSSPKLLAGRIFCIFLLFFGKAGKKRTGRTRVLPEGIGDRPEGDAGRYRQPSLQGIGESGVERPPERKGHVIWAS